MTTTHLRNKARLWERFADAALSTSNKETYSSAAKAFDAAATEIELLQSKLDLAHAETGILRAALSELTTACEIDFESAMTDDEPDNEPVGGGCDDDGKPTHMAITFGMIRRARSALGGIAVHKATTSGANSAPGGSGHFKESDMEDFKFKNGDKVKISASGESGMVVGRADYLADERRYEVRYKATDGNAKQSWWPESALETA